MSRKMMIAMFALALALAGRLEAQADSTTRAWNEPVAPFKIAGNFYYVGAREVSAFLLTGDSGHIVIDGGFAETAPQILANIARLGFRAADVRYVLSSHGHYDHAGGIAGLVRATGARVVAAAGDADLIERGGHGDFAFGDRFLYDSARVDRRIANGEVVRVGPLSISAVLTPGHTKGCTTWTTTVREGGRVYSVVIACSVTAPGYRLAGNAAYTNIMDDFSLSFRRLAALRPDIWVGGHGSMFDLLGKRARQEARDAAAFVNGAEWQGFLVRSERALRAQLASQSAR